MSDIRGVLTDAEREVLKEDEPIPSSRESRHKSTARRKLRNFPENVERSIEDLNLLLELLDSDVEQGKEELYDEVDFAEFRQEFLDVLSEFLPILASRFTFEERAELVLSIIDGMKLGAEGNLIEDFMVPVQERFEEHIEARKNFALEQDNFLEKVDYLDSRIEPPLSMKEIFSVLEKFDDSNFDELKEKSDEEIMEKVYDVVNGGQEEIEERVENERRRKEINERVQFILGDKDSRTFRRRDIFMALTEGSRPLSAIANTAANRQGIQIDPDQRGGYHSYTRRICERLEEEGFVEQVQSGEWKLSEKGEEIAENVESRVRETDDDLTTLRNIMKT